MSYRTTRLGLTIGDFDDGVWHQMVNDNFALLDTVIYAATGMQGISGLWQNSLAVVEGERFVDATDLSIWEVAVDHTSPASGTFAEARAAVPANWTSVGSTSAFRGEWQSGVTYRAGDFAYDSTEILYCVCLTTHVSTTSLRDDIDNWQILVDASAITPSDAVKYTAQTLTASQKLQARQNISVSTVPIVTRYNTAGGPFTHTFNTAAQYFKLIGGGGGGGGGSCGTNAAAEGAGGGSSGWVGETDILTRGVLLLTGTVNVGAKGAGGVAGAGSVGNAGSNGSDTTWVDGTNSFTWGGGKGGVRSNINNSFGGDPATKTGTMYGTSEQGDRATPLSSVLVMGGKGGNSPYGAGGKELGTFGAGNNAAGFSAGGGGCAKSNNASTFKGGDGSDGFLWVIEYL